MKFLMIGLLGFFFLYLTGCRQERNYLYPSENREELQRVCRRVVATNTNRFMVRLGKIYPLNNDGLTAHLEEMNTTLEDAGYFCGRFYFRNAPCFPGRKRKLDQSSCAFKD